VIENDLLEAVIGLPEGMFFNTGISTYIWILTNRKTPVRRGKVQLIDARDFFQRMRKPLGEKRNELTDGHIHEIVRLYGDRVACDRSRLLPNSAFGFRRVQIERPRRVRAEAGPTAVERLRASESWSTAHVRKADASRAEEVLSAVEDFVAGLTSTTTLAEAVTSLQETDAYKALLKKAKDAVLDALVVDDPQAEPLVDATGVSVADPGLRGAETVPFPDGFDPTQAEDDEVLTIGVDAYVAAEVHPHAPDAWVDETKTKVGYEIPFTRIFYRYVPPRTLVEINSDIKEVEAELLEILGQVTE
jgi:type I restriction enzyme M protein